MIVTPLTVCEHVLTVVTSALDAVGRKPARRLVTAGGLAVDDCEGGFLAVAPERVFRVGGAFPGEATNDDTVTGAMAVQVLILAMVCVPTIDSAGNAPPIADQQAAAAALLYDAACIWNTVNGEAILEPAWDDLTRASVSQLFVGPEGGCGGSETRLTLGVSSLSWCLTE